MLPSEEEVWHPLYGFKRDLVQLLGNLLYKCRDVQERTREGGGVNLLLNQCGIDHRNPCIHGYVIEQT
jgi:ataxin-10